MAAVTRIAGSQGQTQPRHICSNVPSTAWHKFLGHAAGALAGKAEIVAAVRSMHNVLGGTVDPFAAYLLLRGMKTLGIRVNQHNSTALEIAKRLEGHPRIQRVCILPLLTWLLPPFSF